jgi:hypothetical protein
MRNMSMRDFEPTPGQLYWRRFETRDDGKERPFGRFSQAVPIVRPHDHELRKFSEWYESHIERGRRERCHSPRRRIGSATDAQDEQHDDEAERNS